MNKIKLVAFDMDGTLTTEPSAWFYIVKRTGVVDVTLKGKELYNSRKISYKAWGDMVINAWNERGLNFYDIEKIADEIDFRFGIEETFKKLHEKGYKTAVVSTGFRTIVNKISDTIAADYVYVNDIKNDGERMLGYDVLVNDHEKIMVLEEICKKECIELDQVCFVGDSMNDYESIKKSGYSIALNAIDDVKAIASVAIDTNDLRDILKYL